MPTLLSDTGAAASQRIFAYARVSTVEQLTENQREQIARAGYNIPPKRFIDEQISGSVPAAQRPGFQRLLGRMDDGDTLVVTKLDRIGRDSIDVQQTVERFQSEGIRLVVLQLGNLDLTSSAGALMVKMLAAVADFERDLIIERTQAGQARARAAGKHMGRPAKTTPDQQRVILERLAAGATVSGMAEAYQVSRATIIAIRNAAL
ncbi:MAG: recombinase family protein [Rhodocyclales bacterium GT-UBC]|nr:MAG: recombinase family protein [Rhodocyclales bacterium GT-UBC]